MAVRIPDRGFCIAAGGSGYNACFKRKDAARRAARRLADATGRRVDLVQVQNRGEDRFVVEQFGSR